MPENGRQESSNSEKLSTSSKRSELSSIECGIAGGLSGFVTRALLQPLDVLKIRFQLQVEPLKHKKGYYTGVFQASRLILKDEGIKTLWRGHWSAQALTVTYGIGQFYAYNFLKNRAKQSGYADNGIVQMVSGAFAGMVGTLLSMPCDIARTRLVAQGVRKYSGLIDVWVKMIQNENIFSLWRGLTPSLLMTVPFAAIQFPCYYFLSSILASMTFESKWIGLDLTKSALCGAASGVTAKIVVYPLDVLKKRIQLMGSEDIRSKYGSIQKYESMLDCVVKVTKREGGLAWFKGLQPSLIKSAAFSGSVFASYELFCDAISAFKRSQIYVPENGNR